MSCSDIAEKVDRVVLRIQLAKPPDEWIRDQIKLIADKLERDELEQTQRSQIAQALRGIAAGFSVKQIFSLGRRRGGQSKIRRHKWIATDYWLRSSLGHSSVAAAVAADWSERSVDTVEDIARKYRRLAERIIAGWDTFQPSVCLDAVAAVRHELLTGEKLPAEKKPEETILLVMDFEELLMPPPEIGQRRAE